MTSRVTNNLRQILSNKGYPTREGNFRMPEEFLKRMGISAKRFNKIVDNEEEMTVTQLHVIAEELRVETSAIINTEDDENFGLIKY